MDLLVDKIGQAVRECGQIILNAKRDAGMVDEKQGHANFVTVYDKLVQEKLKEKLIKILPDAVFVGEEDEVHESVKQGYAFIVDPIDGTTNFIKDYKLSTVSVALARDGKLWIGVVYNPYMDELFYAEEGQGAYLNGTQIHVSEEPLERGLVFFGTSPYYEELNRESFDFAYRYFQKAMDLRRSGSAAYDLCCLAAGRGELQFEFILCPWDFAAGAVILREAGGVITTIEGGEITLDEKCSILATNKRVREELN